MSDKCCGCAELMSEDEYDLSLHVMSVLIIFLVSVAGTALPVFSKHVPSLSTKSPLIMEWLMTFGFGVVIGTGFIHITNDGIEMLSNPCLGDVVKSYGSLGMAIVLATVVLMHLIECESSVFFASSQHHHQSFQAHTHVAVSGSGPYTSANQPNDKIAATTTTSNSSHYTCKLAVILFEVGVMFHSVIVGVDLGVTAGTEFKTLLAAMCFHQFFEGIAVSGSALNTFGSVKSVLLVNVAYATTTPLGLVLGITVRSSYSSTSVTALWVQGVLNCIAGGILLYTGVVELLTHHMTTNSAFLARSARERFLLYAACWLGAGAMALIGNKSIIRASLSTFRDFDHTSHDGHVGVHRGLARRRRRLRIPPRHVSAICTTIHDALAYPPLFCAGVHEIENRKDAAALLAALAQPVLLEPEPHTATTAPAVGKDTGIYMEERLSLRGQRELWSALARLSNGLAHTQTLHLATRFLECAEKKRWRASDPVCRSLAQMIVTASDADASSSTASRRREVDEDESLATIKRDAAFKEAMRQLMLSRLCSPSSLLSALSIAGSSSGDGTPDKRKVLMSFTRLATATASPTTPQRNATRLHRTVDSRNEPEEPGSLRKAKRPRVLAEDGTNGSKTQSEASTTGNATQDTPLVVELPSEMEAKALKLAKQLAASETQQASRAALDELAQATVQLIQETINVTNATQQATEALFASLCATLQLAKASDEALFRVTTALIESNWSSRYASVFLEMSVFPKIVVAASVISRVLLQTALLFSQRYTSALVDSLLIPLLTASAIGPAQGEAITRILRNGVPLEQLDGFLSKSFVISEQQHGDKGQETEKKHFFTNDAALMVLQNVLTMKAPLADATVEKFVVCCEVAQESRDALELQKSLKFATLVFTMVSKYANQCAAHAEALEGIGKRMKSLMAKSTMRAILKLKSSSAAAAR